MGLIDALRDYFGGKKCEKLIKYQARSVEFRSIGTEFVGAKISLAGFRTDIRKVHEATELAKTIDDYQYSICTLTKDLKKDDPDWKMFLKQRAAAISLLTALRGTLIAFKIDPAGQKKNLSKDVKNMQMFMTAFAREAFGVRLMVRRKMGYAGYIPMPTLKGPSVLFKAKFSKTKAISNAFKLAGVKERELDKLTDELSGSIQKRTVRIKDKSKIDT